MNVRALLLVSALAAITPAAQAQQHPTATMASFSTDAAMRAFLRRFARPRMGQLDAVNAMAAPTSSPMAGAEGQAQTRAASPDAITNVQQQGVDEGDIVKLAGDYLVILRRGRLFSV